MVEEALHSYQVLRCSTLNNGTNPRWPASTTCTAKFPPTTTHPRPRPRFERLGLLEQLHGTHVVTVGLDFTPIKHEHKPNPIFTRGSRELSAPSVQTQKHVRPPGGLSRLKSLLQSVFISTHSWSNYWRVHVGWRPFKVGGPRWKHDCSIGTPFMEYRYILYNYMYLRSCWC